MNRLLVPLALSCSLLSSPVDAASFAVPPGRVLQEVPAASEVSTSIDASLRWLRTQQDAGTGSYGNALETALVLEAFLGSPRGYHVSDGPFLTRALEFLLSNQAADGSIGDAGATARERLEQSLAAYDALALVDEEPGLSARRALAGFLRLPANPEPNAAELGAERAGALARALLDRRGPDGASWDGPGGRVAATARAVRSLSRAQAALPGGEAREARVSELPSFGPADRERVRQALERGAAFLGEQADAPGSFGFGPRFDAGITAMVAGALQALPAPRPAEVQTQIDAALDRLLALQKEDGSIHDGSLHNYVTSASILALARRGTDRDLAAILRAREYLRELQADEGEGYDPAHRYYGGVGYGGDERPDLSNLQLALEALSVAGVEEDDESFRKALAFLERTQNRSASNDLEISGLDGTIRSGDDGGAGYAPGESKAGFAQLADGTRIPRSYGSMTYALLRGYLFAGLTQDDPRVSAAVEWLRENWTLDLNPGFVDAEDPAAPYQGLFYYFLSMAKALDTLGEETFVDGDGVAHAWRSEVAGRVVALQRPDGSWLNENSPRWWEGNPTLATAYALLILDATLPSAGE